MNYVVGVFASRTAADSAADALRWSGISEQRINLLAPDTSEAATVPTSHAEGFGAARAMGAVVGGALGLGAGFGLGILAAGVLGPAISLANLGVAGATLFGVAGARGGFAIADKLEEFTSDGVPKDEMLVYEDAVRQGCCVLIVAAKSNPEADALRWVLRGNGAETVDAARNTWWIGLKESSYRAGNGGRRLVHGALEAAVVPVKAERGRRNSA